MRGIGLYTGMLPAEKRERWYEGWGEQMNESEQYSTAMQRCATGLNQNCPVLLQDETVGRVTCVLEQDKWCNIGS